MYFPELRHIDVMCINYSGSVVSIYLVPRNRCSIDRACFAVKCSITVPKWEQDVLLIFIQVVWIITFYTCLIMAQFQNCAVQFILCLALACLHGEIRMLSSLYLIIVTCSNEVHAYLLPLLIDTC